MLHRMREKSLFHLLVMRLRKMRSSLSGDQAAVLVQVAETLKVAHRRDWYELSWSLNGREFTLDVPDTAFAFHVAGDTEKAIERRDKFGDLRSRNWEAARDVWCRIALIMDIDLSNAGVNDKPGLEVSSLGSVQQRGWRYLLVGALLSFLVGMLFTSAWAGFEAVLATLGLGLCYRGLADTNVRMPDPTWELLAIAVGPALTAATLPSQLAFALMFLILGCATVLHGGRFSFRQGVMVPAAFLFALAGSALVPLQWWLAFSFPILAVFCLMLAPDRLNGLHMLAILVGAVAGVVSGEVWLDARMLLSPSAAPYWVFFANAVIGGILFACFVMWWIHGILRNVLAWWVIGTTGLLSICAALAGAAGGAPGVILSFFAVMCLSRLVRSGRRISPAVPIR